MATLRRTRVGAFGIETATPLADLTEENLAGQLVSPADALDKLPAHLADTEADADAIRHGRALPSRLPPDTVARILDAQGALLALGRADGEQLHPFKVFAL